MGHLKSWLVTTVCVSSLGLGGCGTVYQIKEGAARVHGVPFYVKTGACRQEQVYLETLVRVTLLESKAGKFEPIKSVLATGTNYHQKAATLSGDPRVFVKNLPDITGELRAFAANETVLVSNTATMEARVDYLKQYYVNVTRPLVGSASAAAKLAADGTLTEATGEVEDSTLSTLLDLLPINAFLTSKFAPPAPEDAKESPEFRLQVEPVLVRHTLFKVHLDADAAKCDPAKLPELTKANANYRRENVEGGGGAKPPGDNTVTVSGTVVLPKKDDKKEP